MYYLISTLDAHHELIEREPAYSNSMEHYSSVHSLSLAHLIPLIGSDSATKPSVQHSVSGNLKNRRMCLGNQSSYSTLAASDGNLCWKDYTSGRSCKIMQVDRTKYTAMKRLSSISSPIDCNLQDIVKCDASDLGTHSAPVQLYSTSSTVLKSCNMNKHLCFSNNVDSQDINGSPWTAGTVTEYCHGYWNCNTVAATSGQHTCEKMSHFSQVPTDSKYSAPLIEKSSEICKLDAPEKQVNFSYIFHKSSKSMREGLTCQSHYPRVSLLSSDLQKNIQSSNSGPIVSSVATKDLNNEQRQMELVEHNIGSLNSSPNTLSSHVNIFCEPGNKEITVNFDDNKNFGGRKKANEFDLESSDTVSWEGTTLRRCYDATVECCLPTSYGSSKKCHENCRPSLLSENRNIMKEVGLGQILGREDHNGRNTGINSLCKNSNFSGLELLCNFISEKTASDAKMPTAKSDNSHEEKKGNKEYQSSGEVRRLLFSTKRSKSSSAITGYKNLCIENNMMQSPKVDKKVKNRSLSLKMEDITRSIQEMVGSPKAWRKSRVGETLFGSMSKLHNGQDLCKKDTRVSFIVKKIHGSETKLLDHCYHDSGETLSKDCGRNVDVSKLSSKVDFNTPVVTSFSTISQKGSSRSASDKYCIFKKADGKKEFNSSNGNSSTEHFKNRRSYAHESISSSRRAILESRKESKRDSQNTFTTVQALLGSVRNSQRLCGHLITDMDGKFVKNIYLPSNSCKNEFTTFPREKHQFARQVSEETLDYDISCADSKICNIDNEFSETLKDKFYSKKLQLQLIDSTETEPMNSGKVSDSSRKLKVCEALPETSQIAMGNKNNSRKQKNLTTDDSVQVVHDTFVLGSNFLNRNIPNHANFRNSNSTNSSSTTCAINIDVPCFSPCNCSGATKNDYITTVATTTSICSNSVETVPTSSTQKTTNMTSASNTSKRFNRYYLDPTYVEWADNSTSQ